MKKRKSEIAPEDFFENLSKLDKSLFIPDNIMKRQTVVLKYFRECYPDLESSTDLKCIETVLKKKVTFENYLRVYSKLNKVINPLLYSNEHPVCESTFRSKCIKHMPIDGKRFELSKVFRLSELSCQLLHKKRVEKQNNRLKALVIIPYLKLCQIVEILKKNSESHKKDQLWLSSTIQFVQICIGSRWIEVAAMSTYAVSDASQIEQQGIAKSRYEKTIIKPVLFSTPVGIVLLVQQIRDYIQKDIGDATPDLIRHKYLKTTIRLFDKLWKDANIVFNNKTHIWRKSYACISHELYCPNGNHNLYYQTVLGHDHILESLSYSDVKVTNITQSGAV